MTVSASLTLADELDSDNFDVRGSLLARNAMMNLLGQGLPLVAAAIAIPLIIRGIGVDRFGILTLGWVILGYFQVFDVGLSRAITKTVADALGSGDKGSVAKAVWSVTFLQTALGALGAAVLIAATPSLAGRLLSIPSHLVGETRLSFVILALSVPLVLITGGFQGALAGAQRFDLINAVRIPFSVANYLLPLLGMLAGGGLPTIILLLGISRLIATVVHYVLCVRVFPSVLRPVWPNYQAIRNLLGFGVWVAVSSVVGPALIYLDRFMLSALRSVTAAGYYAAPFELATRMLIIPGAFAATLFPALSTVRSQGRMDRTTAFMARSTKYLAMTSGLLSIVLVNYAPEILHLWLKGSFVSDSVWVLRILVVGVLVNSFAHLPYSLLHAHGRPDLPAKFQLLELPVHVVLLWQLVLRYGMVGAAIAWTMRVTLDAVLLTLAARSVVHAPLKAWRESTLRRVVVTLAVLTLVMAISHRLSSSTTTSALVSGVATAAAAVLIVRFGLDERERAFLKSRLPHVAKPTPIGG